MTRIQDQGEESDYQKKRNCMEREKIEERDEKK